MSIQMTRAQAAVVENRGGGLLVSAAAGSGKTRVLVERLLDRVEREGLDIDAFLIITFTRAAAEELRGRISQELAARLSRDSGNRHLLRQTALLYQTQISTIHAFCTNLLREWGQLLELPPDFALSEKEDARILEYQVLEALIETRYEDLSEEDDFARLLDLLAAGRDDRQLFDIVLDVYGKVQSHHNPTAWMRAQLDKWALDGVSDVGQTMWGALLLEDSGRIAAYWRAQMADALAELETDENFAGYVESFRATTAELAALEEALDAGWNAAREALPIDFPRLKSPKNDYDPLRKARVQAVRERCKKAMEKLGARFENDSAELLADMNLLHPAIRALFALVEDFMAAFAAEKRRRNLLDFSDLEHLAVRLLLEEDGAPTKLARELRGRFAEIMVDEYQDTNQIQNAIFAAISEEGRNLFLVGDVKQSIYRFRLADPTIFLEKYKRFTPYENAKPGENRKIVLSENFRSRTEVLAAANDVFRAIMSTQLGEMDYTDEEALYPGAQFPEGAGYETEFYVLDFTELGAGGEEDTPDKHRLEAQFVARRIADMLEEGFRVSDGQGGLRPATPGDFAILMRSPNAVRHHYVRALQELGIACANESGEDFFQSVEVATMLSYLQIIDNPHQDVPLLSVLHSPLWGFDGERMAQVRLTGEGDYYDALCAAAEAGDENAAAFLDELHALRFLAGEYSSHKLLWNLYERTNALDVFRRLPGGAGREERLLTLYELACRFEAHGHRGLFRFLIHLRNIQERSLKLDLSPEAQQGEGVKILSIHGSKGLEYPIVFLAGLGKKFNEQDAKKPVLFHQTLGLGPKGVDTAQGIAFETLPRRAVALTMRRELLAEEMRLLYVAMTRAKEKLIMTARLTFASDLKKLAAQAGSPLDPRVLESCDSAGKWLILAAMPRPEAAVLQRLGDYGGEIEDHFTSRWHIEYHKGVPEARAPLLSPEKLADTEPGAFYHWEELWENLIWQYPHSALAHVPAKLTATQLVGDGPTLSLPETAGEKTQRPAYHRPRFAAEALGLTAAQIGTAHHTVLQSIRLERTNSAEEIAAEITRLTDEGFLTEQEAAAVDGGKILAFFESEVGREMRSARTLHREAPFSILLPAKQFFPELAESEEEILLQGVIDCWYETEEGITVLDFKTNRAAAEELPALVAHYRAQLEAYALALAEMTGKRAARKLIWFLNQGQAVFL